MSQLLYCWIWDIRSSLEELSNVFAVSLLTCLVTVCESAGDPGEASSPNESVRVAIIDFIESIKNTKKF